MSDFHFFIGGPLDGQEVPDEDRNRWTIETPVWPLLDPFDPFKPPAELPLVNRFCYRRSGPIRFAQATFVFWVDATDFHPERSPLGPLLEIVLESMAQRRRAKLEERS